MTYGRNLGYNTTCDVYPLNLHWLLIHPCYLTRPIRGVVWSVLSSSTSDGCPTIRWHRGRCSRGRGAVNGWWRGFRWVKFLVASIQTLVDRPQIAHSLPMITTVMKETIDMILTRELKVLTCFVTVLHLMKRVSWNKSQTPSKCARLVRRVT